MSEQLNGCHEKPPQIDKLIQDDPYLKQHETDIVMRWKRMKDLESGFDSHEGGIAKFTEGFKEYGIVQKQNGDVVVSVGSL